jgi:DNA-binding MarR family transcriptional regulator
MTQDPDNRPPPLEDQLCYAVYSAAIAIQRLYKPFLDELGLTYPQYLVLNVLWREDEQTVGAIADKLALESSTLTPLLKRLEAIDLVRRVRKADNQRQVVISLTDTGRALQSRAGCLGDALLKASLQSPGDLASLNRDIRKLRDTIYTETGEWTAPA